MKNILKSLTVATIMAMAFAGCARESMDFEEVKPEPALPAEDDKTGYFSFTGGELVVEWNGENVNTPTEGEFTRATVMPDTDDFIVELIRTSPSPETVKSGKFGVLKSSAPIELPITIGGEQCYYKVIAHSEQEMANVAYDGTVGQPTYRGETQVPIMIGNDNTTPSTAKELQEEITCKLESIKVSVSLEKEMAELCSKAEFDVKIFDPSQGASSSPYMLNFDEYSHKYGVANLREDRTFSGFMAGYEPACGYLKPVVSGSNGLTMHMSMNYKDITISQDLEITKNANPNEYRNIVLYLVSEDETTGSIIIGVEVHTWVYDEEVVVDVTEQGFFKNGEPKLPDPGVENPNAPTVMSDTFNLNGTTIFTAANYDNGAYKGSAAVWIASKDGQPIEHFTVKLETDDSKFQSDLGSIVGAEFDLADANSGTMTERMMLQSLGFPQSNDIAGRTELEFDLRNLLNRIQDYSGTHKLTMTVTDAGNNTSRAMLTIKYDANGGGSTEGGPEIMWDGYDFNTRYVIGPEGMDVRILMTVPAGIKSLMVHMAGSIADVLGADMPTDFDLVDPDKYQEDLSNSLMELNFPVGDDVKNKTELWFDISDFMPMLYFTTEGPSDFQLTVIDNNGASATATIRLNVVK